MIEMSPKAKKKQDLAAWQLMGAGALAGMSYNAGIKELTQLCIHQM